MQRSEETSKPQESTDLCLPAGFGMAIMCYPVCLFFFCLFFNVAWFWFFYFLFFFNQAQVSVLVGQALDSQSFLNEPLV